MRIAVFTSNETVFLLPMWRKLFPELCKRHEVRGLWVFPDVLGRYHGLGVPLWYLRTFGPATTLQLALHTFKRRVKSHGSYRELCLCHGVSLLHGGDPNDSEVVTWLKQEKIDILLISVGFILKPETIQAVGVGVLNRHSSLLPAYRGLQAVFWTLLENRVPLGLTIHRVDEQIDRGEILMQKSYPEFSGTVFEAYDLLTQSAPDLFLEAIEILAHDKQPHVETNVDGCYRSLPTREDARKFAARGLRLV